jgi:hypothetical protein
MTSESEIIPSLSFWHVSKEYLSPSSCEDAQPHVTMEDKTQPFDIVNLLETWSITSDLNLLQKS